MRLLIAWVVSTFVGVAVCFLALVIVGAISEVYRWGPDPNALLFPLRLLPAGVYACAFGVLLMLQLAYGSLVYFVPRRLGLLNLQLVLLAYLVPIAGLALAWTAPQIANSIPLLIGGAALATVGWFLARPPGM